MFSKLIALFKTNSHIKGAILATIAALSLSVSMSLAKQLHGDIPTSLVVFIRTCFGLIFFLPFLIKNRTGVIKTDKWPWHLFRSIITVLAMLCTYYTYRNLPLAFATSLGMTGPLFTTVLSAIILKDKIGFWKWMLIILGYVGVVVIVRPTSFVLEFAIITALLANLLAALSIILAKILSRYDSTITIMLYSNVGTIITSALLNMGKWHIIESKDLFILFCTGFLGVSAQYCYITSLKLSTPSFIAPFEYTKIFFAILIGMIVFQEIPDFLMIIGSAIIISATYSLTYFESKKSIKSS